MENANVHDTPTYTNIDNNEHETTNDSDIVNEDTTAVKLEKPKTVKPAVKRSFPKDVLRLHRSIDSLSAGQAKICDGEEDFNDGESITIEIAPSTGPYEGGKFKFKVSGICIWHVLIMTKTLKKSIFRIIIYYYQEGAFDFN